MIFSSKKFSLATIASVAVILLSCGRSTTSSEKTTFTHLDSLTETYLTLQDTLLQSWNILSKDEHDRLEAVDEALHHLIQFSEPSPSQLASLKARLDQLKQIHITQKTLANPYVIEEYDFASNSLVSEILSFTEGNPKIVEDKLLSNLIDKIKLSDQRIFNYRMGYDSIANQFNSFLERNKIHLKEIDANNSVEKRSVFNVSASH
jgi:hypothetical protein